jgi:hypothetical protein
MKASVTGKAGSCRSWRQPSGGRDVLGVFLGFLASPAAGFCIRRAARGRPIFCFGYADDLAVAVALLDQDDVDVAAAGKGAPPARECRRGRCSVFELPYWLTKLMRLARLVALND